MDALHALQLGPQLFHEGFRQRNAAILAALAESHDYQQAFHVDAVDTQPDAFHQPQSGTVKQFRHYQMLALHLIEHRPGFIDRHHHRQARTSFGPNRSD